VVFKDVTLTAELLETSESAGETQYQFQLLGSYLKQNKQKQKKPLVNSTDAMNSLLCKG